jgi:hypothetical protein
VQRVGTAQAAAGAAVLAAQLGGRLPHLGAGATGAAPEGVLALKLLARPPRGSSAKEHHGLRSSKQLVYAEQVQVGGGLAGWEGVCGWGWGQGGPSQNRVEADQ